MAYFQVLSAKTFSNARMLLPHSDLGLEATFATRLLFLPHAILSLTAPQYLARLMLL